jgi:hypothetical protein
VQIESLGEMPSLSGLRLANLWTRKPMILSDFAKSYAVDFLNVLDIWDHRPFLSQKDVRANSDAYRNLLHFCTQK